MKTGYRARRRIGLASTLPLPLASRAMCSTGSGRSMSELISIIDDLKGRGVGLKVLTGEGAAIDTTRPEGRLIFGVFAAFSEFVRELIRERTRKRRGCGPHGGAESVLAGRAP